MEGPWSPTAMASAAAKSSSSSSRSRSRSSHAIHFPTPFSDEKEDLLELEDDVFNRDRDAQQARRRTDAGLGEIDEHDLISRLRRTLNGWNANFCIIWIVPCVCLVLAFMFVMSLAVVHSLLHGKIRQLLF